MKANWFKPFQGMEAKDVKHILQKLIDGKILLKKAPKSEDTRDDLQSFCTWMKVEDHLFEEVIRFFDSKFKKGVTRRELRKKYNVTRTFMKEIISLLSETDVGALKRNVKLKGVPAVLENKLIALHREATSGKLDGRKVTFEGLFKVLFSLFSKCQDVKFVMVMYLLPIAILDFLSSFEKFEKLDQKITFQYFVGIYEPDKLNEEANIPVQGQGFLKVVVLVFAKGKEYLHFPTEKRINLNCRRPADVKDSTYDVLRVRQEMTNDGGETFTEKSIDVHEENESETNEDNEVSTEEKTDINEENEPGYYEDNEVFTEETPDVNVGETQMEHDTLISETVDVIEQGADEENEPEVHVVEQDQHLQVVPTNVREINNDNISVARVTTDGHTSDEVTIDEDNEQNCKEDIATTLIRVEDPKSAV
ncbi:hypothetical protein R1sor_025711 [Riccia sorocarpa]|uniref:SPK domain-containing protein n=1 Tax=Riccia sorocarpa TaxID=122646 RepID=A0ABD3G9D9_9MARC